VLNSDTGTDELLDGDAEIARFIFSLHTGSGFVPDPDFHENLIGEFLMKLQIVILGVFSAATFGSIFSGCNGASAVAGGGAASSIVGPVSSVKSDPIKPPSVTRSYSTDVLLFVGAGTWGAEIASLESIMDSHGTSYQTMTSGQLDTMSIDEMAKFGLLIFPGGAGGTEAGSLSAQTHAHLRAAVQLMGVSYLGFCAGAFIAAAPAPAAGQDVSYGLGIVDAPVMDYYYLENQGQDIAMTLEKFPDGSTADLLFYGGPVTPNIVGGVIAKYPNGDPAITQIHSGNGFVIVSGSHPTATQSTLNALGVRSSDGTHLDLAWKLIHSALTQQPMPAY